MYYLYYAFFHSNRDRNNISFSLCANSLISHSFKIFHQYIEYCRSNRKTMYKDRGILKCVTVKKRDKVKRSFHNRFCFRRAIYLRHSEPDNADAQPRMLVSFSWKDSVVTGYRIVSFHYDKRDYIRVHCVLLTVLTANKHAYAVKDATQDIRRVWFNIELLTQQRFNTSFTNVFIPIFSRCC